MIYVRAETHWSWPRVWRHRTNELWAVAGRWTIRLRVDYDNQLYQIVKRVPLE